MTTKVSKKTESSLPAKLTVENVPELLERVMKQIRTIKGDIPETPKTTGDLGSGFGTIESIKTLDDLIKATSMVVGKSEAYKKAAKLIVPDGVKTPEFTIDGMKVSNILDHIKMKAVEVGNKEKLTKLNKIRKELEDNLSEEDKRAKSLAKIENILLDVEE